MDKRFTINRDDEFFGVLTSVFGDNMNGSIIRSIESRKALFKKGIDTLWPREAVVLCLRYGAKMSLQCVGDVIGISRERVRQVEAKALRKLRHPSRSRKLRELCIADEDN